MKKYLCFFFALMCICLFAEDVEVASIGQGNFVTCGVLGDNKPYAIFFENTQDGMRSYYVVYGNERLGPFSFAWNSKVSPNGKDFAFFASKDGQWYVFARNELLGPYSEVADLSFSPDGMHLTYNAKIDDKWYIFDEKEQM